jgi:hypothetical protein
VLYHDGSAKFDGTQDQPDHEGQENGELNRSYPLPNIGIAFSSGHRILVLCPS